MHIKTKIDTKKYLKLMFYLTYKKPLIILMHLIGVVTFIYSLLYFSGIIILEEMPLIPLIFGFIMTFMIPISLYKNFKKNFLSNKRIQENIEYEFTNVKMKIIGESFNSELELNKVHKIVELKNWFLIYQSEQVANLIPTENLNENEVKVLREIFRNQSNVKLELK
ncbi:YcxB family protein [Flavobacterium sp.]|uniref:YcxB family protein n=1 Tax=Flavobacterium sp. TaxID=239 RepID=UPI00391968A3